jgi:two-component system capsular synthesis response regulator RcsB
VSLKIVIADDHPVVRIGARSIIVSSGVGEVVAEAGGTDALYEFLKGARCDVLVTDLSMPGGSQPDGLAMLGAIRRRYPELPIVLLSVTTNLGVLRTAMSIGVCALVDKASSLDQLPAAIQAAHRGRTFIDTNLQQRFDASEIATVNPRRLSPRELEVFRLLAGGLTVTEIANRLHRSVATISRQKGSGMRKLGISNDAELFDFVRQNDF